MSNLPLVLRGDSARKSRPRVAAMLDLVGLGHRRRHFPHQLSGGEMQRAAIARALARNASKLLLADEPTGNLDSGNASSVSETLVRIASEKIVTLVIVTHSEELAALASRHIRMRDGKIEGSPPASRLRGKNRFPTHPQRLLPQRILPTGYSYGLPVSGPAELVKGLASRWKIHPYRLIVTTSFLRSSKFLPS